MRYRFLSRSHPQKSRDKPHNGILSILRLFAHFYTLGALVWVFLWQWLGDRNGWLALCNAWARWILLLLVPAGALSASARGGKWVPAWLAGAGLLITGRRWTAPAPAQSAPCSTDPFAAVRLTLRLLSSNLRNEARPMESAARILLAQNADVMLFVEAIASHRDQLDERFAGYPYRCWVPYIPTNMGLAAVSRHPFAVTGFWQKPGLDPYAMRLTLALPTGPLDVYCVHVIAPSHQVRRWGPTRLLRTREQQIRTVLAEVAGRPHPAVLAGDWNQTEAADAYGWIRRQLVDGWRQAHGGSWGSDLGLTWPRVHGKGQGKPLLPLLRLDYLFHTGETRAPRIAVESMKRVLLSIGSDHCPLVADLLLSASSPMEKPQP